MSMDDKLSGMSGAMSGAVDVALTGFAAELGRRVREQRESIGMPPQMLVTLLTAAGMPMDAEGLARLEEGQWPAVDVRLLIALVFTIELSIDQVIVACLARAAGGDASMQS
jgi:hypothetical protein